MVFVHNGWKLYSRNVQLKGGKPQKIYFFSKRTPKSGTPCDMPEGYRVKEGRRAGSGMPYVTKKR
jgi:hypothetical protein